MKQSGYTNNKEICRVFDNLYATGNTEDHAKTGCHFEGLAKINKIIKGANNHHPQKKTPAGDDHAHPASQAAGTREQ